ncbi:MAG TPA: glycosyltransferase family 9 protein [Bryobacteraceae bacterium]|nr:glycosyltransferase family 9 protein [Bryobacteraceae bacterium]
MTTPLFDRLPHASRVLVIRIRSLGDSVLTTPAIHLLKSVRPDLRISIMSEPRFSDLFRDNPDIEAVFEPSLSAAVRFAPRLVINFHGGTRSLWLTALSLAQYRAGFVHHRAHWIYNVPIPRAQEILGEERVVHTAEHLASAMFHLGVPHQDIGRARLFAWPARRARAYAVLHPVAATPEKTWPADRFLRVADNLQAHGLEPVFIGGPDDDLGAFRRFEVIAGAPLWESMSLLGGAALFVGNDSGPAHVAAAYGVPVVVLFGPSNPAIWSPWRTESRVFHSPSGIEQIRVEQVLEALESLRVFQ